QSAVAELAELIRAPTADGGARRRDRARVVEAYGETAAARLDSGNGDGSRIDGNPAGPPLGTPALDGSIRQHGAGEVGAVRGDGHCVIDVRDASGQPRAIAEDAHPRVSVPELTPPGVTPARHGAARKRTQMPISRGNARHTRDPGNRLRDQ